MPGGRLTQQDRQRISAGLAQGLSYAEIGKRLARPTSTISREVGRNGGPGDYRPDRAHRAAERRARRGTPTPPPGDTAGMAGTAGMVGKVEGDVIEMAVGMGLPRMMARVLIALWVSDDGRLTAAELARRLGVSPASVSTAVAYLTQQGLIRRERDPRRRRDIYVVDEDAWYHSVVTSARQSLEAAEITKASAETFGIGTPVGRRLARGAAFLEQISLEMLESTERWRHLLS